MPYFLCDLHIHTALSACASDEMTPRRIVQRCRATGLDVIAVCDHNTASNAASVVKAAESTGLFVLPGIEAQTSEEVHIIVLFRDIATSQQFEREIIRPALPPVPNRPEIFGRQLRVDERDHVTGEEQVLLLNSLDLDTAGIVEAARRFGAISIAAHASRPAHGYLYTLGMLAEPHPDCFEFRNKPDALSAVKYWSLEGKGCIVVSSDAHSLDAIVPGRTALRLDSLGFDEIARALRCRDSQRVMVLEVTA
ncbi:MAG: PHP domain-containing protein [Bacillota bacterium]|nr:PHP domain-containing protein [Bacillota bacterium]